MISIDSAANYALMSALLTLIEAGAGAGIVNFYAGTRPAAGASIGANVLIATCYFDTPCGTLDGDGKLVINTSPVLGTVLVATMPNWARISDSDDTFVMDCSVRSSADPDLDEELVIDAASLSGGALLVIMSGYFTAN